MNRQNHLVRAKRLSLGFCATVPQSSSSDPLSPSESLPSHNNPKHISTKQPLLLWNVLYHKWVCLCLLLIIGACVFFGGCLFWLFNSHWGWMTPWWHDGIDSFWIEASYLHYRSSGWSSMLVSEIQHFLPECQTQYVSLCLFTSIERLGDTCCSQHKHSQN